MLWTAHRNMERNCVLNDAINTELEVLVAFLIYIFNVRQYIYIILKPYLVYLFVTY